MLACARDDKGESQAGAEDSAQMSRTFGAGPVKLTVEMSAGEITTADPLTYRFILTVPDGYEAEFPDLLFPEDVPGVILTDFREDATSTDSKRELIRTYELGEGVIGPYGHMLDVPKDEMVYVKK